MKKTVAVVGADSDSTAIIVNELKSKYEVKVILEKRQDKIHLLRMRLKRLGFVVVLGQLLFLVFSKFIKRQKRFVTRRDEILVNAGLSRAKTFEVAAEFENVNSDEALQTISALKADLIVISGTRILSKKFVKQFSPKILNIHAGVTPKYRGVHGAYWALVGRDVANCGVTVHYIDEGVDTGGVIGQARITPESKDYFWTYPYLQIAAAIPLLNHAIEGVLVGSVETQQVDLPSKLWYHPTLWGYLMTGAMKGVW
jgi:folate-dependent phosphoribosylglycinamide formyltransferase PurN